MTVAVADATPRLMDMVWTTPGTQIACPDPENGMDPTEIEIWPPGARETFDDVREMTEFDVHAGIDHEPAEDPLVVAVVTEG